MYCSHCGAQIADESRYCANCGYKITVYSGRHEEKRIPVPIERSRTEMIDDADRFYRAEETQNEKRSVKKKPRQTESKPSPSPSGKSANEDLPWRYDGEDVNTHSNFYRVMSVLTGVLFLAAMCMSIVAWRLA